MQTHTYVITALILTLMGVLFAGYMTFFHIFTNRCAFGETCPLFLGKPACWYGLGMFSLMFIIALLAILNMLDPMLAKRIILAISLVGIVFASSFAFPEIKLLMSGQHHRHPLLLPTCTWGLVFYIWFFRHSWGQAG